MTELQLWLEPVAAAFGLFSVYLTVRQNILCWPVGIVTVLLSALVYYRQALYGEVGLHSVYLVLQCYGWYYWLRGGEAAQDQVPVTRLPSNWILPLVALMGLSTMGLGLALSQTDTDVAFWDAGTTVVSLVAQWLMARKILECWALWFAVDVVYVGLYHYKTLNFFAALYLVYLVLAVLGWRRWNQDR